MTIGVVALYERHYREFIEPVRVEDRYKFTQIRSELDIKGRQFTEVIRSDWSTHCNQEETERLYERARLNIV